MLFKIIYVKTILWDNKAKKAFFVILIYIKLLNYI
jgi:hypothetical protein